MWGFFFFFYKRHVRLRRKKKKVKNTAGLKKEVQIFSEQEFDYKKQWILLCLKKKDLLMNTLSRGWAGAECNGLKACAVICLQETINKKRDYSSFLRKLH